jgi:glycosyltransferase involved in cell wall biosynthesis
MSSKPLPLVSIVIATFNSARILPPILRAIEAQTYPRDRIELLFVDGGSTDDTAGLAQRAGARFIHNPLTEPVNAKFLGFQHATGDYLVYLDHDEEYMQPEALADQVAIMQAHPQVRTVDSAGYSNPPGYPFVNEYINEFGDPFSFFIYRQSRGLGFHVRSLAAKVAPAFEDERVALFKAGDAMRRIFMENLAAGIMTDLAYVRQHVDIRNGGELCHLFYWLNARGADFAVAKRAGLRHYSGDTLRKFLVKVRWRIKNNIYHIRTIGQAGFGGREKLQPAALRRRKYLFLPYAFSLVLPLADAIWLALSRRKALYLLHLPFTLYTAWQIAMHLTLKAFGYAPPLMSYDESKVAGGATRNGS